MRWYLKYTLLIRKESFSIPGIDGGTNCHNCPVIASIAITNSKLVGKQFNHEETPAINIMLSASDCVTVISCGEAPQVWQMNPARKGTMWDEQKNTREKKWKLFKTILHDFLKRLLMR